MTEQRSEDQVPNWVTAAPDWLKFETPNVPVVPAYEYHHLRGILQRLVNIPAVRQAVGDNHTKTCPCPMCFAREELKRVLR